MPRTTVCRLGHGCVLLSVFVWNGYPQYRRDTWCHAVLLFNHKSMARDSKFYTGVTLDRDVVAYLGALQKKLGRDRSYLINALVKEHRRSNGSNSLSNPAQIAHGILRQ